MGANKTFKKALAYEQVSVRLYAEIAIGATGAPTITKAAGITSISRTSAGLYVLTLDSSYNRLLAFLGNIQDATGIEDLYVRLKSNDVAGAKTITFTTLTTTTATDPASGDSLFLEIVLKNSSIL